MHERSSHRHRVVVAFATLCAAAVLPSTAAAASTNDSTQFGVVAGSLAFATAPHLPTLGSVTLNGQSQTTNSSMTSFSVQDATGSGAGWNVTVDGDSGGSPVFRQYCPTAGGCGSDAQGYVSGGTTLPANSLSLDSNAAAFSALSGSTGTAPSLTCASGCAVDSASPVKVASAASNAGMGTWQAAGWSATSLALVTPASLKLPPSSEVYRTNIVWTLNTGP